MQYMPGCLLGECCGQLTDQQKICTGMDLANVIHAPFQITAPLCGSLWWVQSKGLHTYNNNSSIIYSTPWYPICNPGGTLSAPIFLPLSLLAWNMCASAQSMTSPSWTTLNSLLPICVALSALHENGWQLSLS